jgi:antitoxin (DNA-binding transcriptional repressor) of toxin-antitoxin stability system
MLLIGRDSVKEKRIAGESLKLQEKIDRPQSQSWTELRYQGERNAVCCFVSVEQEKMCTIVEKMWNSRILIKENVKRSKGGRTMSITAMELKTNLSKYLLLAATEDVYITRNGKTIAKLTNPYQDRLDIAESLFGSVPTTMTLEQARDERLDHV